MRHITGVTEDPATGSIWVTGFSMENIPTSTPPANQPPFYHPYLAEVLADSNSVDAISLSDINDPNLFTLALPLSIVWTVPSLPPCIQADITGDGSVDVADLRIMAFQWLQSGPALSADIAPLPDGDNFVGTEDLVALARFWTDTGCTE